jgi:hypothetical protein
MSAAAIERLQSANKRARAATQAIEQGIVRKATIVSTGLALGFAAKKGMRTEIANVPIKLGTGLGLAVVELFTKGAVQRFAAAVSDANLAIYSHEAVQTGSWVAGGEV